MRMGFGRWILMLLLFSGFGGTMCRGAIRLRQATLQHAVSRQARAVLDASSLEDAAATAVDGEMACLLEYDHVISMADKAALRRLGVHVVAYIPDQTVLVLLAPERVDEVAVLPHVMWMGGYAARFKVSEGLGAARQRTSGSVEQLGVLISTTRARYISAVAALIDEQGGEVISEGRGKRWGVIHAKIPATALAVLAASPAVEWVGPWRSLTTANNVAAEAPRLNVQAVWENHGLRGSGQVIAVADTGLDTGAFDTMHPDFSGRIRAAYGWVEEGNWTDYSGHGTLTAGSALGSGAAWLNGMYRGVAHEAELVFQAIGSTNGSDAVSPPSPLNLLFEQARADQAAVHSDSWGALAAGAYTELSREVDEFMWDCDDMLIVFPSGNSGSDENADGVIDGQSINSPATAKNCLTVGASESARPAGSGGRSGDVWPAILTNAFFAAPIANDLPSTPWDGVHQGVAAFSSRGPCADGRTKPDVLAPGTDIISCRSSMPGASTFWGTGEGLLSGAVSNWYCFAGGSSMAAPMAAGCAGLARQYLLEEHALTNAGSALVKALLAGGARSLTPGQYGTNAYREIPAAPRPNMVEGWGQLDAEHTLFPADGQSVFVWDRGRLQTGETNVFSLQVTNAGALTVTLCWNDYPAALAAGVQLVNDLDLCLLTPSGDTIYPHGGKTFDRLNNLLGIDVPVAETGIYQVVVSGFSVPEGPQRYALCARFVGQVPASNAVWYAAVAGEQIFGGEPVQLEAQLSTNQSGAAAVVAVWRVNGGAWSYTSLDYASCEGEWALWRGAIPLVPVQQEELEFYVYVQGNDGALALSTTQRIEVESKVLYVSKTGSAEWPYGSWDSAFTSLVDAVEYAGTRTDYRICVTNGSYAEGETLYLDSGVECFSVNGPEYTVIDGQLSNRCVDVSDAQVRLHGFTLMNGAAQDGACLRMSAGVVSNCILQGGAATGYGGGAQVSGGLLTHSRVQGNTAAEYGGGLHLKGGRVAQCVICDNTSAIDAGGVELWEAGVLENCTLAFNHAEHVGGGVDVGSEVASVRNCIIVSNTADAAGANWYQWNAFDWAYICSAPVPDGVGNFNLNPLFADEADRDFHLKSRFGRYGADGEWIYDVLSSPCLAMGDPNSDYSSEPEPNGARINLGAYGNTDEASKFSMDEYILIIQSDQAGAEPPEGHAIYSKGNRVLCTVATGQITQVTTQFVCTGWTLNGTIGDANSSSGTTLQVDVLLTNNAILYWNWNTNYFVTLHTAVCGRVSGPATGWHAAGEAIQLNAVADDYCHFTSWTGTLQSAANPLTLALTRSAGTLGAV